MICPLSQHGIDACTENFGRAGLGQKAIAPGAVRGVGTTIVYVSCEDENWKTASRIASLQTSGQVETVERSRELDVGDDDIWLQLEGDAIRIPRIGRLQGAAALLLKPLRIHFPLIA
jgi:hypothetical protein